MHVTLQKNQTNLHCLKYAQALFSSCISALMRDTHTVSIIEEMLLLLINTWIEEDSYR